MMLLKILISANSDDLNDKYKEIKLYTANGTALGHSTMRINDMPLLKTFSAEIDVKVLLEAAKTELKVK